MGRITSEFLGTFLLCCFALIGNPLSMALGLAVLLWVFGGLRAVTFNPAATFALLLRRRVGWVGFAGHLGVQLAAALVAALVTGLLAAHNPERLAEGSSVVPEAWLGALVAEGISTFGYVLVFLAALASRRAAGSLLAPFVVGAGAFALQGAFASLSSFMNPAVLLAWGVHDLVNSLRANEPAAAFAGELARFGRFVPWAFVLLACQVAGTAAAWLVLRVTHPEDR